VKKPPKTTLEHKPWMNHVGRLKHLASETARIERRIEEAFERIDHEIWLSPNRRSKAKRFD
jgi:hypothetical protein